MSSAWIVKGARETRSRYSCHAYFGRLHVITIPVCSFELKPSSFFLLTHAALTIVVSLTV